MGWNPVVFRQPDSPFVAGLRREGEPFYFVHSYHCVPADDALTFGVCDYGGPFVAAIARGRCVATQFHPEKSQAAGLRRIRDRHAGRQDLHGRQPQTRDRPVSHGHAGAGRYRVPHAGDVADGRRRDAVPCPVGVSRTRHALFQKRRVECRL